MTQKWNIGDEVIFQYGGSTCISKIIRLTESGDGVYKTCGSYLGTTSERTCGKLETLPPKSRRTPSIVVWILIALMCAAAFTGGFVARGVSQGWRIAITEAAT